MWEELINSIHGIGDLIYNFVDSIIDIFGFIISIFGFIWYAGKTLVIGVWKLILYVFDNGVFHSVSNAFVSLSYYIGGPATIFISALLFVIIIRILVAFVFKILRLNIDYHKNESLTDFYNKHAKK